MNIYKYSIENRMNNTTLADMEVEVSQKCYLEVRYGCITK